MRITDIHSGDHSIEVEWEDGSGATFTWFWLRDHASDKSSWNPETNQRETFTAAVSPHIRPSHVSLTEAGDLVIEWPDTHSPSCHAAASLRTAVRGTQMMPTPLTWDATVVAANEIPVNWKDLFLGTECRPTGLQTLLGRLSTLGFCRIQEVPALQDSVLLLANAIGYVRRTVFGDVWTFSEDGAMADSAYSAGDLRPHTDGTYSEDAPGLQLLLCLEYAAKGGLSVLVDGFRIVQALAPEHRRMLEKVGVTGRYRGDGVDLQATRPIVRRDSAGNLLQISFNNYDRAPLWLPEPEMTAFYDALRAFDLLANDPTMQWQTQLAVGELIVFDNWRLLHGRTSYQGHRTMTGCYVNREDFLSCLRTQPDTLPG